MKNNLDLFIAHPNQKYTGYVWLSNEEEPIVLIEKTFDFSQYNKKDANPFIIEALLYCKENSHSYIIRHTHRYVISAIDIKQLDKDIEKQVGKIEEKLYLAHPRLKGVKNLIYNEYWLPEIEKESSCDFPTLQLKANVFIGFK